MSNSPRSRIRLPHWGWCLLATVLLVVFAAGLRIGLPIYRRHVAIQTLSQHGLALITEPTGPAWLRQCIGDHRMKPFDDVTLVDIRSSHPLRPTDAEMPAFQHLIHIRTLNLKGTAITDEGLKYLNTLSKLKFLDLSRTRITDAGLVHLKGLKSLTELYVGRTAVSEAGITNLKTDLPKAEIAGP